MKRPVSPASGDTASPTSSFNLREVIIVNLKLCLIEIISNKTRSVITSFGIFLGIAALLVNMSFLRAMDDDVRKNLEKIGGLNVVTVKTIEGRSMKQRQEFGRSPGLTLPQVEKAVAGLPHVKGVLPKIEVGRVELNAVGRHGRALMIAVGAGYFSLYNYQIASGRFISTLEMNRGLPVCVIGSRLSERVFGANVDPVGKKLSYQSINMTVVGTIFTENKFDQRAGECLIPYDLYTQRIGTADRKVNEVPIVLTNSEFAETAARDIGRKILSVHRGIKDFDIDVNADKIKEMKTTAQGLNVLLFCIAFITLCVGGVSIMNIMFATIGDRIREIGLRKALGAQTHDIFAQFIIEAVLVCCVGGIPGMLLGTAVTLIPRGIFPFNPRLALSDYLLAFVFTVCAGFLSGLAPALKAAKMQPVEALRF